MHACSAFMWDIGKQNSPRCDAAECGVASGAIMYKEISCKNEIQNKNHS